MNSILRMAIEADQIKPVEKEDEMVFYGRIKNFDELKKADSMETHEQYEVKIDKTDKNAIKGRIRCRKTTPKDGDAFYTLTTKTPTTKGMTANSNVETNIPATEEIFTQYKGLCSSGMVKDRYKFKIDDNHTWEVDVYKTANGTYQSWVKIDLEIHGIMSVPDFPFELEEIILAQNGNRTPEEETKIRTLYDTVFTVPNPFIGTVG